jgi:CspA family cold shock protein
LRTATFLNCANSRPVRLAGAVLSSETEKQMPSGIVKWFNLEMGYGFIQPDGGGREVLVHVSAVRKAGLSSLTEGARLSYELVSRLGKQSAKDLNVASTSDSARVARQGELDSRASSS